MLSKEKIEAQAKYWINTSGKDFKFMQDLYKSRHYDWCLFMGYLILEKALKTHVVLVTKK